MISSMIRRLIPLFVTQFVEKKNNLTLCFLTISVDQIPDSAYEQVGENHQIHNTVVYPFGSATALLTLKHRSAHSALSLCGKRKNKNYKQKQYYFHLR